MTPELGSATVQVWARRKAAQQEINDALTAQLDKRMDDLYDRHMPKPWLRPALKRLWKRIRPQVSSPPDEITLDD